MTKLSVNVNKIATLRNSRGGDQPSVLHFSRKIVDYGAHGITVHPRPDGRHIREADVLDIARMLGELNQRRNSPLEFNIEGFPSPEYLSLVKRVRPDQVTLVPDPPTALTSNAGWKMKLHAQELRRLTHTFKEQNIRVSLFVDPMTFDAEEAVALESINPDRIELYTENFAKAWGTPQSEVVTKAYASAAQRAQSLGCGINAGHDLNLQNLSALVRMVPQIEEVSIGHALICDALTFGMETTVKKYLKELGY